MLARQQQPLLTTFPAPPVVKDGRGRFMRPGQRQPTNAQKDRRPDYSLAGDNWIAQCHLEELTKVKVLSRNLDGFKVKVD